MILDKAKLAALGVSADPQVCCMWRAFSDDMAKPNGKPPIRRESTGLTCVPTSGVQTGTSTKTIGAVLGDEEKIESLARRAFKKALIAKWIAKTVDDINEIASRHTDLFIVSPDDLPILISYSISPTARLPADPRLAYSSRQF